MKFPEEICADGLRLRPLRVSDAREVFEGWTRHPKVSLYIQWKAHHTLAETEEFLKECERLHGSGKKGFYLVSLGPAQASAGGALFKAGIRRSRNDRLSHFPGLPEAGHRGESSRRRDALASESAGDEAGFRMVRRGQCSLTEGDGEGGNEAGAKAATAWHPPKPQRRAARFVSLRNGEAPAGGKRGKWRFTCALNKPCVLSRVAGGQSGVFLLSLRQPFQGSLPCNSRVLHSSKTL